MGKRDYRHREPKKSKKSDAKISPMDILATPAQVEIIKKQKKQREEPAEEG
jgi:hypothetical protein